ncbi:WD40/YVTN/BNR-like repeat-containing protein [Luteitalea sp.]|uniref:WD40/YVTN/BNR-like repeat-containing protein n=1 Tax=Luteitalea sp. TaxID=2004800 RepID=UPI0037C8D14B
MTKFVALIALVLSLVAHGSAQAPPAQPPADDLDKALSVLKWRGIGPFRGGRANAAVGVPGDTQTYYMGTTGGGLWKTEDAGLSWKNISDGYFQTASIGAIAIAGSDHNVIYVGSGEHAVRGVMTHGGDGVYKSTDAGRTWKRVGLEATQHIARIIVHPTNPDVVYVAAQGQLYGPSPERGVFKSVDGGTTWRHLLKVDEKTGASELSMDATNPRILYAAMWEHGRQPWKITSGGPGSGLYKSTDAGETWQKLTKGLPTEMGKMAIAVSRTNPDKVWALIEGDSMKDEGRGLFVSTDAGKSWSQASSDPRLVQRAWYYIEVFVDPNREDTVYVLSAPALRTTDGGKTWSMLSGTHGDYHDLWINPADSNNFVISNDGGAAITFNAGKSWSSQSNMPTAQFYRISVDNQFPYRIYAGQQDNTSVSIASRAFGAGGIGESDWTASAGGESAFLAFDADDPRYVLGGSYQGTIEVLDTKAKAGTNVMAAPIQYLGVSAKDMKYRYNWNAPIIASRHERGAFYHGAQVLLKTTDMGKTWKEVSPDLTRNEKAKQDTPGGPYTNEAVGAENYGTLAYVMESPHEKGVIWTGSDDGLVHLTRDGGATWKNVTPKGLAECLINAIEVSPFDKGTAYIATTRYKFNDQAPGLYKTTDYGATWTKIDRGIPHGAFTRVVREDETRRDLLFAGTERGLYMSWNGGQDWVPFQRNLPMTPITDLRVHKGNLIAATSGRSFWILDDLSVLRQYKKDAPTFGLYEPSPAYLVNGGSALDRTDDEFTGADTFTGVNPATGVVLYYRLPELKKDEDVTLEIADGSGKVIRTFSSKKSDAKRWDGGPRPEPTLTKQVGLNRFVWNMRHSTMPGVPNVYIESSFSGHKAVPGTYTATLKRGDQSSSVKAQILPNPLYTITPATYTEYDTLMTRLEGEVATMHRTVNSLYEARVQLEGLLAQLPSDQKHAALKKDGEALVTKLKAWDGEMVQRRSRAYDDVENFPNGFTANWLFMLNQTESDLPRVNQPSLDRLEVLSKQWAGLKARADDLQQKDLPAFNKALWEAGVGAIWKK